MFRIIIWSKKRNKVLATGDESIIAQWKDDEDTYLWLDAYNNNNIENEKTLLIDNFSLHPLIVSDAQRVRHPPKFETIGKVNFLLLKELITDNDSIEFNTSQLAIFCNERFILSRRSGPSASTDMIWDELLNTENYESITTHNILMDLAQAVSDKYIKLLLNVETSLENIEDLIFKKPDDRLLAQLVTYQTHLRKLTRILSYHRQIFDDMKSLDAVQSLKSNNTWVNVYEHAERGYSLSMLYYETSADLIDGYISVASHRLNQIMKVLTIITVIFVPLSFIAGIYGMNFENMPELKSRSGYFILLGIMFSLASLLLFLFKRKKWL